MGWAKPGPAHGPNFFLNKKPWVGRADSEFQWAPMGRNGPKLKKNYEKMSHAATNSFFRKIHCIPASSAAVERCFSSTGFIVNERRTSLHIDQIDNMIVIRSMEKLKSDMYFFL